MCIRDSHISVEVFSLSEVLRDILNVRAKNTSSTMSATSIWWLNSRRPRLTRMCTYPNTLTGLPVPVCIVQEIN